MCHDSNWKFRLSTVRLWLLRGVVLRIKSGLRHGEGVVRIYGASITVCVNVGVRVKVITI